MNKLMLFPMTFLLILTLYSMAWTSQTYTGSTTDVSQGGSGTIEINDGSGDVNISNGGTHQISLTSGSTILAILVIAIAIGIVAGITVLGSGVSGLSQSMIFVSVFYIGIWGALSVVSGMFLLQNSLTEMLWIVLTMMFILGLGSHMTSTGD